MGFGETAVLVVLDHHGVVACAHVPIHAPFAHAVVAPIVDDERTVQPDAHAVIVAPAEAVAIAVEVEGTRPARRPLAGRDRLAGRTRPAPVEVDGRVVAHKAGCAAQCHVGEVLAAPLVIRVGRAHVTDAVPPDPDLGDLLQFEVLDAHGVRSLLQADVAGDDVAACGLPRIDHQPVIHPDAHAVVHVREETIRAGREVAGLHPAGREEVDLDARVGRAVAPVEVDGAVGAHHAGHAAERQVVVVFRTPVGCARVRRRRRGNGRPRRTRRRGRRHDGQRAAAVVGEARRHPAQNVAPLGLAEEPEGVGALAQHQEAIAPAHGGYDREVGARSAAHVEAGAFHRGIFQLGGRSPRGRSGRARG